MFFTPTEVRRSFEQDSRVTKWRVPRNAIRRSKEKRIHRTNFWPGERLDYALLESAKELLCTIKHPTGYYKHGYDAEYRVSVMPWSSCGYLDIRQYRNGHPTAVGILLHRDILNEIYPYVLDGLRRLDGSDTREEDKKAKPIVIPA